MVDFDGFRQINDNTGHRTGFFPAAVGTRIRSFLRAGDTVARLGGDEFGILIARTRSAAEVLETGERVMARIQEPLIVEWFGAGLWRECWNRGYPRGWRDPDALKRAAGSAASFAK